MTSRYNIPMFRRLFDTAIPSMGLRICYGYLEWPSYSQWLVPGSCVED